MKITYSISLKSLTILFIFVLIISMLNFSIVSNGFSGNDENTQFNIDPSDYLNQNFKVPSNKNVESLDLDSFQEVLNTENQDILSKLRDNKNEYTQVFNPWKTRAANHVVEVSDDGELVAVGSGYLLDNEVNIYRWNIDTEEYEFVWAAGSGIIQGDIFDLAFGDSDNNDLLEIAVASGDGRIYLFEQAHIFDPFTNLENQFDLVWISQKFFQVSSIEFYDVDLDGITDLVAGSWDNKIHIFEYTRNSGYPFAREHWIELEEKWTSPLLDDKVQSLNVGDVNKNGLPDIVVGTFQGSVYIFENDGIVVPTPNGGTAPFANDNEYTEIWSTTGSQRPIWNPISHVIMGDLDGLEGDEVVLIAWGQGVWSLQLGSDFFLEQIVKPFESWQTQGAYPLDNFADWMLNSSINGLQSLNVYPDSTRVASGLYATCDSNTREPNFSDDCYSPLVNSGSSEAPDGVYSEFKSNSTHGALAVWEIGTGEEIATNGNTNPDVYVIMPAGGATPSDWNISISNDLTNWFYVNNSMINVVQGISTSNLAIDLDPIFSENRLTKAKYYRMEFLPFDSQAKVDAIVVPYVARPLTTAVSATLDPLSFSYFDKINGVSTSNKIIFGTTDGRILAFEHNPLQTIEMRNPLSITNFVQIDASDYGMQYATYQQKWDSFENDFYNLQETIWSIHPTPKSTFIPSWRYIEGSNKDFSLSTYTGPEKAHQVSIQDVSPLTFNEIITSSNSTTEIRVYDEIYQSNTAVISNYLTTNIFGTINSYNFDQWTEGSKILTFAFGEFDSDYPNDEIITFAWYKDPLRLNDSTRNYDPWLNPIIWKDTSGSSGVTGNYGDPSWIFDKDNLLYSFLSASTTYPSAFSKDLNGDGLIDIVISNGRLAVLWNIGTTGSPNFELDTTYFDELNELVTSQPIFNPQLWDYDLDGDFDLLYSYGRSFLGHRYGLDFYKNNGDNISPKWERIPEIVKNPTLEGGLRNNKFTFGALDIGSSTSSAAALWVYSPVTNRIRKLLGEVNIQSSYMVTTNPNIYKLEVNKLTDPTSINFGYTVTKSWSNIRDFDDWTLSMATGILDNDASNEIIVSDFDNNVYVFEHLTNNTYKRAFKTFNLNHTVTTSNSPYKYDELEGIDGIFERTIFDHGNLLATNVDFDNDGNLEFIVTAALSVYIFEATGFNDDYKLIYEVDYGKQIDGNGNLYGEYLIEFDAIATGLEFDGRGSMLALASSSKLFLLRYDSSLGWLESFQAIDGSEGLQNVIGNSGSYPDLEIKSLLFADLNQDNKTELWLGGINNTGSLFQKNSFLIALQSDYGNVKELYTFTGDILENNEISDLYVDDQDYDGKLELIIAHKKGIDIWEIEKSSTFIINRIEVISSDPSYGTQDTQPSFGSFEADAALGTNKNDILQLANGDYVVTYGNDLIVDNSPIPLTDTIGQGVLRYVVTPDPDNLGTVPGNPRVSTEPFDPSNPSGNQITYPGAFYAVLQHESQPAIVQGYADTSFYMVWVAYYQIYTSANAPTQTFKYRVLGQRFYETGVKTTPNPGVILSWGNIIYDSPGIASDPNDPGKIWLSLLYNNQLFLLQYSWSLTNTFSLFDFISYTTLGLDNYVIQTADFVSNVDGNRKDINTYGVLFSGYSTNSTFKINKLHYLSLNKDMIVEGVFKTSNDQQIDFSPSITLLDGGKNLVAVYEKLDGYILVPSIIYSNDYGRTWSQPYDLNNNNGNLMRTSSTGYETLNGARALVHSISRPKITSNGQGDLKYQYIERFLISQGADANYGNVAYSLTYYGLNYYYATQMYIGAIPTTNWFNYDGISNVRFISTGDSDNDLRKEILIGHENEVTLLELSSSTPNMVHTQKWKSPKYDRQVSEVSIFDANGNGWAEIIYTVKGGDLFAFEIMDRFQPKNDFILLADNSSLISRKIVNDPKYYDLLIDDFDGINGLDVILASKQPDFGVYIVDQSSGAFVGTLNDMEGITSKIVQSENGNTAFVSEGQISLYNPDYSLNNSINVVLNNPFTSYVVYDYTNDGIDDLVVANTSNILVIDITANKLFATFELISGLEDGYFDLNQVNISGTIYLSLQYTDLGSQNRIFWLNGTNLNVIQSFDVGFNLNYDSSLLIGDYDGDGELEGAFYRYNNTDNRIQVYNLDSSEITENVNLLFDIKIPELGNEWNFQFPLIQNDINLDGVLDLIYIVSEFNSSNPASTNFGSSISGIFAVDLQSGGTIWKRTFNAPITGINTINTESAKILLTYVENEGAYAISYDGSDYFWSSTADYVSSSSFYRENGELYIAFANLTETITFSKISGKIKQDIPTINKLPLMTISNTFTLYNLDNSNSLESFVYPVDVTGNGAQDIFVAFSNGTYALRNFNLGEYWRQDTSDISFAVAAGVEYLPNKYGLAISTSAGRLLILERITNNILINVSNNIDSGGTYIKMISLSLDGNSDVLLLQSIKGSETMFSIFDPALGSFIWDLTLIDSFEEVQLAKIDSLRPEIVTHLILRDSGGGVVLEPLPNTLVDGGNFVAPISGTKWVDLKLFDNTFGLTTLFMLSDLGEIKKFNWLDTGGLDVVVYPSLNLQSLSYDLIQNGSEFLVLLNSVENGSELYIYNGTYTLMNNFVNYYLSTASNNGFYQINNSDDLEILLFLGNMIAVFDINGNHIESRSFSSSLKSFYIWYPDTFDQPALLGHVKTQNIEVSDPFNRIISSKTAAIDQKDASVVVIDDLLIVIPPNSSWTEYTPPEDSIIGFRSIWLVYSSLIIFVPFGFRILLKRRGVYQ